MVLKEKIKANQAGIVLYGLTPPSVETSEQKALEVANTQLLRLENSQIDALVIYDLQDEKERNKDKRTFDFKDTLEPLNYYKNYLKQAKNAVIYKAVSKYNNDELKEFFSANDDIISVFVGASSVNDKPRTSLNEAYEIKEKFAKNITLGGICIPERHASKKTEHERMAHKIEQGCEFFISQAVCNLAHAKELISSYAKICEQKNIKKVPIIFTFTPCGDAKTMNFMRWLGIDVPLSFEQRLLHSSNPLEMSIKTSLDSFKELYSFGAQNGISVGANIESISRKRVEIEASINLLDKINNFLKAEN